MMKGGARLRLEMMKGGARVRLDYDEGWCAM